MANASFYSLVQPGGDNGGNSRMLDMIDSNTLPYAFIPQLRFEHTIKAKDLADSTAVAQADELAIGGTIGAGDYGVTFTNARTGAEIVTLTTVVHEDTITIGGTASDGNYDAIFVTPAIPVRARVVRDTTPATNDNIATQMAAEITDLVATSLAGIVASASANTNVVTIVYEAGIEAQSIDTAETTATGTIVASVSADADAVAAALEALIETARATTLADYVADETVTTDTISIDYVDGVQVSLSVDFPALATGTITTTNVATIPLGRTGDWFPTNVWVDGALANVVTAFDTAGSPTITIEIGGAFDSDANDPNGLLTSTSITTAGPIETIAAALSVEHFEAAYVPTATITSDALFADLTAGDVSCIIRYNPPPTFE